MSMIKGISVVICAHNSSSRIQPTLAHLAQQTGLYTLNWEILLIDNASTDNTSEFARSCWTNAAPLRIIYERRLGLNYARWRGVYEAKYDIVSFIDDDNWVATDWVSIVVDIMSNHIEVGACGGQITAVYENEPPAWFDSCSSPGYAIGKQAKQSGDVTWTRGYLWGAGLSIRKTALMELIKQDYVSLLTDRKGKSLSSGGDLELCFALRLAGWRLWYDERLRLQHYMPTSRLQWEYLRRLNRADGASSVGFDPYHLLLVSPPQSQLSRLSRSWLGRVFWQLVEIAQEGKTLFNYVFAPAEGNPSILRIDRKVGRLIALLSQYRTYDKCAVQLRNAKWVKHATR